MNGLFITSNNTDSGKTFIGCQIIKTLNDKLYIIARKPIETACKKVGDKLIPSDGLKLQHACKNTEDIDIICPYKFEDYTSGELASIDENISLQDLINTCKSDDFLIVEGAGGFYSPLIKNTLNSDFAKALNLAVIIVIEDKIGCISEALLTISAVKKEGLKISCVVLNIKKKNNFANAINLQKYSSEKIIIFDNEKSFKEQINELHLENSK